MTSKEYVGCAFTQKVLKFGKMMTNLGHEVIHYGHEDSNLVCSEHVAVVGRDEFHKAYGDCDWRSGPVRYSARDSVYQAFYKNSIREIEKRRQKNDFILAFWGRGVKPICDAHQKHSIVVEPGIGYSNGHWAFFKVFESYALMHAYWGLKMVEKCSPKWYEVVIPNYFDLDDFEYQRKKKSFVLFLGRVYEGKGIHIAQSATKEAGLKLVVAGQKPQDVAFESHVEFVGFADSSKRRELLRDAMALIAPSMYVEPFGGVQIEALLSGTPTITTDWGAFAENNINGLTGYRCRTHGDFVQALRNVRFIDSLDCRKHGIGFSLENVGPMYEKYFKDVLNIYNGNGWYQL